MALICPLILILDVCARIAIIGPSRFFFHGQFWVIHHFVNVIVLVILFVDAVVAVGSGRFYLGPSRYVRPYLIFICIHHKINNYMRRCEPHQANVVDHCEMYSTIASSLIFQAVPAILTIVGVLFLFFSVFINMGYELFRGW